MSIKFFNEETQKWEKKSSMLANNLQFEDVEGNYDSENVGGAFKEIAANIQKIKSDVKYIYENGTIGGGSGGGGGASTPVVTIDGATEYLVNSDDIVDIYYYFTSPNPGTGEANLTWGSKVEKPSIAQGRNKWTVGPFVRGTHNLTITVMDKQGFWSTPVTVKVVSGSLAVVSNFSDSKDFTLNDDVAIPYQVLTEVNESVILEYTFNGTTTRVGAQIGDNVLTLGKLPFMGISTLRMKVSNSKYTSNELKYTLVATDSTNLFMSTAFDKTSIEVGKNLQLDYRISMKGQYSFNTDYYIDGVLLTNVKTYPGVNFWNVGTNMNKGTHSFKIVTTTVDGAHTAELTINLEVVSSGYDPYRHVRTGLIAEFDATGKLNNSSTQKKWEDTSGNGVLCNLYNFNYFSNGWIDNTLVCSGKSYAEIDMQPFLQGVKNGFTVDILCKIKNVGDVDARVLSCKAPLTPFQGFDITTSEATIVTKRSEKATVSLQDDTWTKITYVVNRSDRMMLVYENGVISAVTYLQPNDLSQEIYQDEFSFDGKIYIGGRKSTDGTILNNSVSEVKNIRIYNRALPDADILMNYIADFKDETEQMALRDLNSNDEGMPTITFIGNFTGMDENSERQGQISYEDPKNPSKRFVKDGCWISWQGTSSKNYPVKNWTIKLRDGGNPTINYAPDDNWRPEDRWTLKANFMDSSNANNVGTNKFIYDFFKPYPYPNQIKDKTTRMNVDGFPVRLVKNGVDMGIYTWNIDRYANNNYGFETYNADGTINRHTTAVSYEVAVNGTTGAAAFLDDSWDSIKTEFKSRYNYRGDESAVTETLQINGVSTKVLKTGSHNELQTLITWVKNCTDDQFRSELDQHFSKRHLIDYFLICYVLGMVDNLGKNMVLSTWGKNNEGNTIWYPSFYDCDSLYGLNNSGYIAFDAGLDMDAGDYNTSRSNLWVKLNKMFGNEIRERYCELRLPRTVDGQSVPPIFSYENIMSYIGGKVMDGVGQKYYNQDARLKYLNEAGLQWLYLCNGSRREFTERWVKERFVYMDSVYQYNYDSKSVIRSYAKGQLTLKVKTYSPQWILISFSDAADTKMKLYVNKDSWTTFSMYVDNGTDNNIEIYGVDNVMYLDGLKDLDVRSLNIANARKLIELDISGSTRIEEISLGRNDYLQKVLVKNCTKLGYLVDNKTLDLTNCATLKELDASNTHIANVTFNQAGGVIEKLNLSNTDITAFKLNGQEYLPSLALDGCLSLSELNITNCNGLEKVTMANTKLASVLINGCDKLNYIDISNTKSLKALDLSGCPNLKTLLMAGVSNPAITDLDLTYSLNLEELDISSTNYISNVTFGQYTENGVLKNYNKLKILRCDNSAIKSIRYGKASIAPTYMDLIGLSLTYLSFSGCSSVTDIRNINLVSTNEDPFNNCTNLVSIQGTVKLVGSTNRAFNGCGNLTTLPTLNLSEMTSMSETFMGCTKLSMTALTQILVNSGITSSFTSAWKAFGGCTGITGTLPSNIFSKLTGMQNISEFFNSCTGINGTLAADLLKPMTNLTNAEWLFYNTNITGEVPMDFLRYNTKLQYVGRMFCNTKVTYAYLDNLLYYNTALLGAYGMFQACASLQLTLTENMFLMNKQVNSLGQFFANCPGVVGQIPRGIFNNIGGSNSTTNNLNNVEWFFSGTSISGGIPAYVSASDPGLLDKSPNMDSVQYLFNGCSGLTGEIPVDFLKDNKKLTKIAGVFLNCNGLTGTIPPNLLKGKTEVWSIAQLFRGCSKLSGNIPIGFLDDNSKLTDVQEMFYGCSGLTGEIPKRISTWSKAPSPVDPTIQIDVETVTQYGLFDKCVNLVNMSAVFQGCRQLRSEIPATLFVNASKVVNMSSMFNGCVYLYGPIPEKLFENCRAVQNMSSMFQDCVGLNNPELDADRPYALPETLFQNCFNLTTVSYMFCMVSSSNPNGSRINGALPATLFSNCTKLTYIDAFMYGCGQITGELDSNLFRMNTRLANAYYAFCGTAIAAIGAQLFFTCTVLKNLSYTFASCGSLRGAVPEYWLESCPVKATTFAACYRGDTAVSNYATILAGWK
jgi:hypothetical protein